MLYINFRLYIFNKTKLKIKIIKHIYEFSLKKHCHEHNI